MCKDTGSQIKKNEIDKKPTSSECIGIRLFVKQEETGTISRMNVRVYADSYPPIGVRHLLEISSSPSYS